MMNVSILLLALLPLSAFTLAQDSTLYKVDTIPVTVIDTLQIPVIQLNLGRRSKRKVNIVLKEPDVLIYSVKGFNPQKANITITDPKPATILHKKIKSGDVGNVEGSYEIETSGSYLFTVKNKSLKNNTFEFNLKLIQETIENQPKITVFEQPPEKHEFVYDTVIEIVHEEQFYLGAKKNIVDESLKVIDFQFPKGKVPTYWNYVVGFGETYGNDLKNVIDPITKQPIADPLVELGKGKSNNLPESENKNIKVSLKTPNNTIFNAQLNNEHLARRGNYTFTLTNKDQVVGEYIYIKIVSYSRIQIEK